MKQTYLIDLLFEETGVMRRDISKVLSAMKQIALQHYLANEGFSFDDTLQNPYKKPHNIT